MIVHKCDRCGKIFENKKFNAEYCVCKCVTVLPLSIDLCDECAEKAEQIVKDFMEGNNEKHG